MNKYLPFVNIARFFAILLVVFGHTSSQSSIVNPIFSFHVPLFFILSGLLFKPNSNVLDYTVKRFKRLIIPYFIFYIITLVFFWLFEKGHRDTIVENEFLRFIPLFTGSNKNALMGHNIPLWFLPALFTCEVIFNFIITTLKKSYLQIFSIIAITSSGYLLSRLNIWHLPWGLSPALVMIFYYSLGYYLKPFIFSINSKQKILYLFILSSCIFYFITLNIEKYDVAKGIFPEFYKYLSYSILGSISIISLCLIISKNKILETLGLGNITLFILSFHGIFNRILLTIVKWGGVDGRNYFIFTFIICLINISLCYGIYHLFCKIKDPLLENSQKLLKLF